ncbi:hypothetical protein ABZT02_44295 [Streptomyces sp. NPDC005402]|uniref:hypothetical protein n=1 Tax=Streptomyces sp. NPDC005402 TaxID=3155338 RepID=UPI0033BE949C
MAPAPLITGILDPHPDGPHLCVKCMWCRTWHSAPTADMTPGQTTHLVARCTAPNSPYLESGYSVKIISRRTQRSRSCARGRFHRLWRTKVPWGGRAETAL